MQPRLIDRLASMCLAVTFTFAVLGGIDQLSQRNEVPAQWAQNTAEAYNTQLKEGSWLMLVKL